MCCSQCQHKSGAPGAQSKSPKDGHQEIETHDQGQGFEFEDTVLIFEQTTA